MLYRMRAILDLLDDLGMQGAVEKAYVIRLEELAKARTWPNRVFARIFGTLYVLILVTCGTLVRRRELPPAQSAILRGIATQFFYVPEIVIFKGIELIAASDFDYRGRGLDLGCGTGFTGSVLASHSGCTEMHGVDRVSHSRHPEYASFAVGNAVRLPYANESFDFVISFGVIDHIPDLEGVLSEVSRILKPGGALTFAIQTSHFRESTFWYRCFSRLGLRKKALQFQRYRDVYDMIFHYKNEEEWRRLLAQHHMSVERVEYIFEDRHLFWYDLMNMQTYFLNVFFADQLMSFLSRHPRLRQSVIDASVRVAAALLVPDRASVENSTRYLFRARKQQTGLHSGS